jgi:hypothetical protein
MFRIALALGALALVGCAPPVPESGAGVGFQDYSDYRTYRSERETALAGERLAQPPQNVIAANPLPQPATGTTGTATGTTTAAAPATGSTAPVVTTNNPGISDEQDFTAVAGRESIESDRERLAAQREAFEVIQPTTLPARSGASGPNIVQFALSTTNRVGERVHRRSGVFAQSRYDRNCAKYPSPDLAQEAFLASGGPERDRDGLDPDGDGFACSWDPTPFRRVTANR